MEIDTISMYPDFHILQRGKLEIQGERREHERGKKPFSTESACRPHEWRSKNSNTINNCLRPFFPFSANLQILKNLTGNSTCIEGRALTLLVQRGHKLCPQRLPKSLSTWKGTGGDLESTGQAT